MDRCPYCHAGERTLAHRDIQDWSFYGAPGKWNYWECSRCQSLYLSPRPTPASLARAYGAYYTHRVTGRESLVRWLKERIVNEGASQKLKVDLRPRLYLPRALAWMVRPMTWRVVEPFEIAELLTLPAGRLMDVGCGHGYMLMVARQLGWQAVGLESDPAAVRAARARGVEVLEGSYARLTEFPQQLDCVICSHVIEHLYDPQDAIVKIAEALTPGGTLLLSSPNATSLVRTHFRDDWRGLEAPRHLSIPSMRQLEANLRDAGFHVRQRPLTRLWTAAESSRIRRRGTRLAARDRAVAAKLEAETEFSSERQYDFVEFTCTKAGHGR